MSSELTPSDFRIISKASLPPSPANCAAVAASCKACVGDKPPEAFWNIMRDSTSSCGSSGCEEREGRLRRLPRHSDLRGQVTDAGLGDKVELRRQLA
jgi:hypothetical protein